MTAQKEPYWYLSLMAPKVKEGNYAWLDPSRLYMNAEALSECVTDLSKPFEADQIDLVAGIDAMGFILGAAIANKLNKGFLAIRKAGHLCVETEEMPYTDYQKREKMLELRKDFPKGSRVLVVDQWIETGGTMKAATALIEKLGGSIVGIAVVAMEEQEEALKLKEKYKLVSCVPQHLQGQINNQYLESFKQFGK